MGRTIHDIMKVWPADRRAKVEAEAARLIDEVRTLQDLRKAHALTQEKMADLLGIKQENVSRVEKRADMLLSTLQDYVGAMGGKLNLVVEFKNRNPVLLTGIMDPVPEPQRLSKRPSRSRVAARKLRATSARSSRSKARTTAS